MARPEPFVRALDAAGYRLTGSRRTVADLIAAQEGHFTAADLIVAARERRLGVGRATIFRSLDLFTDLCALERLDLPSGRHAYVRCEPSHHHHLVCSRCGRTQEVEDCGMQAVAQDVSRRTGFRIESHRLELYGICPDCRDAGRVGPGTRRYRARPAAAARGRAAAAGRPAAMTSDIR